MAEETYSQDKENIPTNSSGNLASVSEKDESQNENSDQQKRLDFLLKQAQIFTHFVTNGTIPKHSKKREALSSLTLGNPKEPRLEECPSTFKNITEESVKIKNQYERTPFFIRGEMRDYQIRGLNWLISLYENNINGILADEMGLGKTIQSIAIMGHLKHVQKLNGHFLVVAPLSTVPQWLAEVEKFCPSLRPIVLKSDIKIRDNVLREIRQKQTWDVCITSYNMFKIAISSFHRVKPWQYVIIDEAQMIKNENTLLSVCLRSIKSQNRLLLSGTPLQNNLHELWSLLNFLLPDLFASSNDFDAWFDSNDCLRNEEVVKRLQDLLQPFMLRRIKAEVEKTLLPKKEIKLFVGMSKVQYETYKKVLLKDIQILIAPGQYTPKMIQGILMELRKAGNHPYLIDGIEPGPPYTSDQHLVDSCGKMMVLDKLLAKLKSQGSRVVLFSQFTMMLDILEDYVDWCGYKYRRLDGKIHLDERTKSINEFNAKESDVFIFLISTRAGGLGINLATADTVIIYDSDWNPQSDFQAIDRVHRIGQKKQVRVFRLITENTVDERIVRRAEIKKRLDKLVVQSSQTLSAKNKQKTKTEALDCIQMIRMNAEYIFSSKGSDNILTDVDIDAILKDGELKTDEETEKLNKMGEVELQGMTLEDVSRPSVYEFEGIDFRTLYCYKSDNTDETKRKYLPRKAKMGKTYVMYN